MMLLKNIGWKTKLNKVVSVIKKCDADTQKHCFFTMKQILQGCNMKQKKHFVTCVYQAFKEGGLL